MASIPDFLQESFQGVQKALEQKYKDMILEHEKNISYGLSEEDYTPNYGDKFEECSEDKVFVKKILELRTGRWVIYYKKLSQGPFGDRMAFIIDNHGETYNWNWSPTCHYIYRDTLDIYEKRDKNKYQYPLTDNMIKLLFEYCNDYRTGQLNERKYDICNTLSENYQKQAEYYYKLTVSQKENKRLLELLAERGQKSDNLEKSDTPKTFLQRFQEKLKAI